MDKARVSAWAAIDNCSIRFHQVHDGTEMEIELGMGFNSDGIMLQITKTAGHKLYEGLGSWLGG